MSMSDLLASKFPAMPPPPAGWSFTLDAANEWRPREETHPAYGFVKQHLYEPGTVFDWKDIPPEVNTVCVPVLYTRDEKGLQLTDCRIEPRFVREGTQGSATFAVSVEHWVMHRPVAAIAAFEAGDFALAMVESRKGESKLHRSIFLKSREQVERAAAMNAFKVLFQHYSFNEELWRLEKWVEDCLPFDLDEHPEMVEFRRLLDSQVGHLRENGRISASAISRWYKEGSPPAEGFGVQCAQGAGLQPRHRWLIAECDKEKYTKVAEWGSVNAISLFALSRFAPHIGWVGFESNPKCRDEGIKTALEAGFVVNGMGKAVEHGEDPKPLGKFHLLPFSEMYKHREFDAVSLFEVLEHNDDDGDIDIIAECLSSIRVGGTLFITTPCGNWSGFDEHTRDLELRKDHINSFTPRRMIKLLQKAVRAYGSGTFEVTLCERVENPELTENNSWVHCAVVRRS